MKKIRILFICTVIIAATCLLVVGCTKPEQITSVALKDMTPDSVVELQMGNFDYSAYTVLVNYDSGSVEEVALSEDMISELDRLKFYQPGEHTVTISHAGKSCELKISVKRNVFGEIRFPENNVFAYDGSEHKVEIYGEIPPNATVSYIGGNSFINAGTYDVTAVVACNGYVTKKVTTTVTVTPAKYDVSGISFESKEFVYDGNPHSIEISGQLPEGVPAPTYYINGNPISNVSDVGEYKVVAVFTNGNTNYEMVPNMEATLTITPAQYDIGDVDLVFKDTSGNEFWFPWKQYDGSTVTFDMIGSANFKDQVSVSYTVTNENGEEISHSNTDTKIKDAGVYTVKAELILLDNKNYKELEPLTYTFEVSKAEFDTSGIVFESKSVLYSGEKNSLVATVPVTMDLTKFDVSYEYYHFGDDEVIQQDGKNADGVYNAGEYTVRAVFTVKDKNYDEIPPIEAKLVVEKKEVSVSELTFYNTTLIYTGDILKPSFYSTSSDFVDVSDISVYRIEKEEDRETEIPVNGAIDVGVYRAKVTISLKDSVNCVFYNGSSSIEISSNFTVQKAEIDITGIGFASNGTRPEFDTKNVRGLSYQLMFYKADGDSRVPVGEAKEVFPNESGIIDSIFSDTFNLESGLYICTVTVSSKNSNYILSNGDSVAEYDFEFSI